MSGVQRRIESNYRRNIAKVVRPDLVVRSRDALELFGGEVSACVDGFKSTIVIDTDALNAMGCAIHEGEFIGAYTEDADFIGGIVVFDDVGFFTVGAVAIGPKPPVGEVLIGLDDHEIREAIDLVGVGVSAEITVEFVFSGAANDDVTSVVAANEVVAAFGIKAVSAGETAEGFALISAFQNRASDLDTL